MRAAFVSAEKIKLESNYLGGTIGAELVDDTADFDHDAELLLKFHGIYQQDDRDIRAGRFKPRYKCLRRGAVQTGRPVFVRPHRFRF